MKQQNNAFSHNINGGAAVTKYTLNLNETPFYPIHWHEEMEIIRVDSGVGELSVDGKRYTLSAGDIVILTPFVMHSFNKIDSGGFTLTAIVFNLRLLETGSPDLCNLKYFAPMLTAKQKKPCIVSTADANFPTFSGCLGNILTAEEGDKGYELLLKANLYWIFYHMYTLNLVSSEVDYSEDKRYYTLKRVLEYIRQNYQNEIAVTDLATKYGYSEFYLMKLFKKFFGETIVDYINHFRLDVAGKLLTTTSDDISTIAYLVGFNNVSYFNRQFRQMYGESPKEFRLKAHV
jgi:AraC-like DNA-binding protein